MGSEMCIRDRYTSFRHHKGTSTAAAVEWNWTTQLVSVLVPGKREEDAVRYDHERDGREAKVMPFWGTSKAGRVR